MIISGKTKKLGLTKAVRHQYQSVGAGHNIIFSEQEVKTQKVHILRTERPKGAKCLGSNRFCGSKNTSNKASRVFWQQILKTNFAKLLREFCKSRLRNSHRENKEEMASLLLNQKER